MAPFVFKCYTGAFSLPSICPVFCSCFLDRGGGGGGGGEGGCLILCVFFFSGSRYF